MLIAIPSSSTPASQPPASDPLQLDLRGEAWDFGKQGRWEMAVEIWKRILDNRYDDGDAANELGQAYAALGKHSEAVEAFERALQFRAEPTATRLNLGAALIKAGRPEEARIVFGDILAKSPDHADALTGLASALRGLKKYESALTTASHAVERTPKHIGALVEKGEALAALKRVDEAIVTLRGAVDLDPAGLAAGISLAKLLREKERGDEASIILRSLDRSSGGKPEVLAELGASLSSTRDYAEAISVYRRLIALQPASPAHYLNYSSALSGLDRFDEAIAAIRQTLAIEPHSTGAHFNLAFIHLTLANFDEGWPGYEYRFAGGKAVLPEVLAAPWCGEDLRGKSILVIGEQGNGDHLQFIRYLRPLVEMGADVHFCGHPRLLRILSSIGLPVTYAHKTEPEARYDYQCYLASLPGRFHKLGQAIPSAPYLRAEPDRVELWRKRIGDEGLRIGIAWQGFSYTGRQALRSFQLDQARALAEVKGVRLISLQVGKGSEQLDTLPPGMVVETLGADFDIGDDGFIDAAAVMECCDLIVTCDTSLAHLAGALGRPVWIALNESPEWRWQRHRDDTPWYGTARLFRQQTRGDWDGVFRRMADALREAPAIAATATAPQHLSAPTVEVSWGEVVDKITILEIKAARAASDEVRDNVRRELSVLTTALSGLGAASSQIETTRAQLRQVNETLWDVEDELRRHEALGRFDETFVELARSVYRHNDRRAALKREINQITRSAIVEEKLYQPY